MECSLVYRACSTKGIAQGGEIQHRDWEFKSLSNSPSKLEPTMTSLFLQSLQARKVSEFPATCTSILFPLLFTLPKAMRVSNIHPQEDYLFPCLRFFPPHSPLHTSTLQPFFIFPPEKAAFTPAQTLQLTRMRATGLYLCITSKAFIGRQSQNCQHTTLTCISLFIHHS